MIFYCVFWAFENWTQGFYLTAVVSEYLRKSLRYGGWELVHIPWDYMFWYVLKIPLFSHCGYIFWFILPSYLQIWSSCMMYQNFDELYDNLHRCHFKSFQDGCVKGQYILIITFFFILWVGCGLIWLLHVYLNAYWTGRCVFSLSFHACNAR